MPERTRTSGLWLRRPALYPLSYGHTCALRKGCLSACALNCIPVELGMSSPGRHFPPADAKVVAYFFPAPIYVRSRRAQYSGMSDVAGNESVKESERGTRYQ